GGGRRAVPDRIAGGGSTGGVEDEESVLSTGQVDRDAVITQACVEHRGRAHGGVAAAVERRPVLCPIDRHCVVAGAGPVDDTVVEVAARLVGLVGDAARCQAGDEDLGRRFEQLL